MEPFRIPELLGDLAYPYPDPGLVLNAAGQGGEQARIALAQLWLSEGLPYAFRECPAVYESIRSWLSAMLDVHAKEIGIVGSARLGASLARNKLGRKFSDISDLDLFIVSKDLFEKLREEFCQWSLAFEGDEVTPRNEKEEEYWADNNKRGPKLIGRGFLDQKMIPCLEQYPVTKKIGQVMWQLVEKLKLTPSAPKPSKASARCYKSWDSFVRQNSLNLRAGAGVE